MQKSTEVIDGKILVPIEEINKIKREMVLLRQMTNHLIERVSELKQVIEQHKEEAKIMNTSRDHGMSSETVAKNNLHQLTLEDLAEAAIIRISNIKAGEQSSLDAGNDTTCTGEASMSAGEASMRAGEARMSAGEELLNAREASLDSEDDTMFAGQEAMESKVRPLKPLLYGIIRHNPSKRQKIHETARERQRFISQTIKETNCTIAFPKCKPMKTVKEDPEWKTPTSYLHKKNNASQIIKPIVNSGSGEMIPIGTGNTRISKEIYSEVNWNSYTIATRKLLIAVFPRKTLATHSLTGKASPAFANKPAKMCLDKDKVNDIVITVSEKCNVKESLVRNAITTKCADENKMLRMKQQRNKSNGIYPSN